MWHVAVLNVHETYIIGMLYVAGCSVGCPRNYRYVVCGRLQFFVRFHETLGMLLVTGLTVLFLTVNNCSFMFINNYVLKHFNLVICRFNIHILCTSPRGQ